jgi:uncharacterized protein
MHIQREIDKDLEKWWIEGPEKPLLLRGARQVGKSTSVRHLAKSFEHFLEINFEEQRQVHKLFEGDLDPIELCKNLSILFKVPIVPGKTLLFFDEVQACVPAISSLRFFYEKIPTLHVIAAGSLLEFALSEIPSFGVGRVRSMFHYPLSFDEYLNAIAETSLLEAKNKATIAKPLPEPLHQKLNVHIKRFLILGGMPEVVSAYIQNHNDFAKCGQVLDDLIISLRADFAKYKKRVPSLRIAEAFDSVVQQSGGKFNYAKANVSANQGQIKEALELLVMAGLVISITHTSANGIPLGAESNPKKRKMQLLDTGIFQRLLGLNIAELLLEDDFDTINKGAIAEQHVAMEILKSVSCYRQESLYFWHREAKSSNAEVDYVIQKGQDIIPIEVKSGSKGSMQSMFLFMKEKKSKFGIRFSMENFSEYENVKVYPLYAVSNFVRG